MADTAMSRAEYGAGSMFQRSSDWRWIGTIEAGYTASGARRRLTVSTKGCTGGCAKRCPHVAAIKRKMRDKKVEVDREGHRQVKRTTSVAKWSEMWLEDIQTKVRPSAYETDRAAVRAIVAAIGAVKLADLTPTDVKAVAKRLRAQKKSTSTALRYHGSLIRMLKAASREGYAIPPNVLLADKPTKAVNDRQAVSFEHSIKALEVIAKRPNGSRWALAFLQGLRQAEALGLTWDQVDLDRGALTISWQVKSLRYVDRADPSAGFQMPDGYEARHLVGATHLVRPKSQAGWRVIPLVPWATSALRVWRDLAPPHELVWPGRTRRGLTWPRNPASDRDEWEAIQTEAGIAHPTGRLYAVHEIRHGTATLLMELGVPESVRIAIMGHSSIAVTRGYEFVDIEQSRKALEQVAERLALTPPR
ncbi:tyrosine-type recombinase/integrase [Nocardioides sp. cx-169]|uniref:tyrosine-type recombinase/integrase n=1 Tax=Nocardioides sp. cx-169 TaxID=2899080 RepID=UPI001E429CA1|nr:tyrosine-type recombinase/integrase [Nocardioides sp. cx-169]MCD4535686.1 tyrosine-type recombinase/integrase [Nocardioides sp. cx-169]